jgi:hypothetical protein
VEPVSAHRWRPPRNHRLGLMPMGHGATWSSVCPTKAFYSETTFDRGGMPTLKEQNRLDVVTPDLAIAGFGEDI